MNQEEILAHVHAFFAGPSSTPTFTRSRRTRLRAAALPVHTRARAAARRQTPQGQRPVSCGVPFNLMPDVQPTLRTTDGLDLYAPEDIPAHGQRIDAYLRAPISPDGRVQYLPDMNFGQYQEFVAILTLELDKWTPDGVTTPKGTRNPEPGVP